MDHRVRTLRVHLRVRGLLEVDSVGGGGGCCWTGGVLAPPPLPGRHHRESVKSFDCVRLDSRLTSHLCWVGPLCGDRWQVVIGKVVSWAEPGALDSWQVALSSSRGTCTQRGRTPVKDGLGHTIRPLDGGPKSQGLKGQLRYQAIHLLQASSVPLVASCGGEQPRRGHTDYRSHSPNTVMESGPP